MAKTAEEFLLEFAPNVVGRLEGLEMHAKRVDEFLFKSTEERPSFERIAHKVDKHVDVLCDYAGFVKKGLAAVKRLLRLIALVMKWLAIIAASLAALAGAWHTLGGTAYAQAGINESGSFAEYVHTVLASKRLVQLGVLMAFGLLGIAANYTWRWVDGQIRGSLWHYLVLDHPRRTLASLAVYVGWVFGVAFPCDIVTDATAWTAVIASAINAGFAIDVVANKATRAQWTPQERAAKGTPGGVT